VLKVHSNLFLQNNFFSPSSLKNEQIKPEQLDSGSCRGLKQKKILQHFFCKSFYLHRTANLLKISKKTFSCSIFISASSHSPQPATCILRK